MTKIADLKYNLIVIGAGAAGLMAAGEAAKRGKTVLVIDKNDKLGRKIRITGKGRCNVTNNCEVNEFISATVRNGRFLHSAANAFTPKDTMGFFESLGVPLKTERGNRVFPVSDNANDIAEALVSFCKSSGVKFLKARVSKITTDEGKITGVVAEDKEYSCENLLIATGGASYTGTGSTGDGYRFAKSLGHKVEEIRPSLIALTSDDEICGEMQGLSLKNCKIKLIDTKAKEKKQLVFSDFGEMLFTHFGISGPMILSASAHIKDMEKSRYVVSIDLKPALSVEELDQRLIKDFTKYNNKNFSNSLSDLLPNKMIEPIIKRIGIDPFKKCNSLTREERLAFLSLLKDLRIEVSGFRSLNEAIVTRGGINIKEIDPKTMKSKLIDGLYFAGEVIDLDAYTGGFNLQIAFSTGYLVGNNV